MDVRRAQEIASSPVMANVTLDGKRIYIDHVNGRIGSANIHHLDSPDYKMEVPLVSLIEH